MGNSKLTIAIDSYNSINQTAYGGILVKIDEYIKLFNSDQSIDINIVKFDKWTTKLKDVDILHFFKAGDEYLSLACIARKEGIPIIVSAIQSTTSPIKIRFGLFLSKVFGIKNGYSKTKMLYEIAESIIVESSKEKTFICHNFGITQEKITLIPNGISLKGYKEELDKELLRTKFGIYQDYLLHIGRFNPNKNQKSIIDAVKGTDIVAVFIGGPSPGEDEYYAECQKLASTNCIFLGWVDHESIDLAIIERNAKACILASHTETFGISLFETGVYGARMIASEAVPLSDWGLDECCVHINSYSVESIRAGICQAMREKSTDQYAAKVREVFSWDKIQLKYIKEFEKVRKI